MMANLKYIQQDKKKIQSGIVEIVPDSNFVLILHLEFF